MAEQQLRLFTLAVVLFVGFFSPCLCKQYDAVFSFGDSLSDAGNMVVSGQHPELTTSKVPYGMTFFGRPTGRCSDGRLVVDFIAEKLGLPLPPPSKSSNTDFRQGANFAIIGATALDYSFFKARGIDSRIWNTGNIDTQIQWFESLKPSLCTSDQACKDYFSKSLFVVGEFGGNDYNAPIFSGVKFKEVRTYIPQVVGAITAGVEKLIGLGATDLVVPGVLPIGCFPVYLTLYNSSNHGDYNARTGCLRRFNRLAFHHNLMLKQGLSDLRQKHPEAKIIYGDYFSPAIQFAKNPANFGFSGGALRACCGAGGEGNYNFNLNAKCGEKGATACPNPSTYVSWDGIHMTEAAYRKIADGWLQGPYAEPTPILKD